MSELPSSLRLNTILLHGYPPFSLAIRPSTDRGCFHLLATVNGAVVNMSSGSSMTCLPGGIGGPTEKNSSTWARRGCRGGPASPLCPAQPVHHQGTAHLGVGDQHFSEHVSNGAVLRLTADEKAAVFHGIGRVGPVLMALGLQGNGGCALTSAAGGTRGS